MIEINSDMGAAMAEAVKRNKKKKSPQQLAAELEQALRLVEILKEKNRKLELQLARPDVKPDVGGWTGETVEGRPVVTLAQAARTLNLSYQSAYRRIASGKWEATQLGSRDWRVFVDADGCPLMKSSR